MTIVTNPKLGARLYFQNLKKQCVRLLIIKKSSTPDN
nr:MAG TPA: hypothetical protein [Caudoviricetes sp.]